MEKLVDFTDSPKTPSSLSSPSKSIGHSALPRPYSPQPKVEVAVVATRTSRRYALDEAEVVPLRSVQTSSEKWTNV